MGAQPRRESSDETITISVEGRWYVARDESTGVASQGETKVAALEQLAEALRLHGRSVPEDDDDTDPSTAPWLSE